MSTPREYWAGRYSEPEAIMHHVAQNHAISHDFLEAIKPVSPIDQALRGARRILEVGCGTGELAEAVERRCHPSWLLATDASEEAIREARRIHPGLRFECCPLEESARLVRGRVDLVICSNTLEHFRDPHAAIRVLLEVAVRALVIVPYCQPVTDSYNGEGGAGHAVRFDLRNFSPYRIVDGLVFTTSGWTYSSKGERPRQLAVLLEARSE